MDDRSKITEQDMIAFTRVLRAMFDVARDGKVFSLDGLLTILFHEGMGFLICGGRFDDGQGRQPAPVLSAVPSLASKPPERVWPPGRVPPSRWPLPRAAHILRSVQPARDSRYVIASREADGDGLEHAFAADGMELFTCETAECGAVMRADEPECTKCGAIYEVTVVQEPETKPPTRSKPGTVPGTTPGVQDVMRAVGIYLNVDRAPSLAGAQRALKGQYTTREIARAFRTWKQWENEEP